MTETLELDLEVGETAGRVRALLVRPAGARWLYVLAPGAGAGMRHAFLAAVARALADREVATFRYQFPYMERRE
ncbi:MAG: alpha/beta family hydrolase, partial [Gemmatimonadales bacterium]